MGGTSLETLTFCISVSTDKTHLSEEKPYPTCDIKSFGAFCACSRTFGMPAAPTFLRLATFVAVAVDKRRARG